MKELGYEREAIRPTKEEIEKYTKIPSLPKTCIDGIDCFAIHCDREKFDRKKILNKSFKPLGYETVKQGVGSVGLYEFKKQLSEHEALLLSFDFGSWRQTIKGHFSYQSGLSLGAKRAGFVLPFIYWTISYPHGGMIEMKISSEKLFTMAFDNIAFLANMLEKNMCHNSEMLGRQLA